MSSALSSGDRAFVVESTEDAYNFKLYTYKFVVDHEVIVFDYQSSSNSSNEPRATEREHCAGPFWVTAGCTGYDEQGSPIRNGAGVGVDGCVPVD